jgi:hypothetical protein
MRRKLFCATAATAALAALGSGGPASAGHSGRCPNDGFDRISATIDPVADKNGDGWICSRQIGAPPGVTAFSDVDNNAQGSD